MHPLIDHVHTLKSELLKGTEGTCLDIFTLPKDTEVYSSSQLQRVVSVALNEKEEHIILQNAPTRPRFVVGR